jgi:hypothetical protein
MAIILSGVIMLKSWKVVLAPVLAVVLVSCGGSGPVEIAGVAGVAERFVVKQQGEVITNFGVGEDKIVIDLESAQTSETLTYLDLVSPFAARLNAATAIAGTINKYPAPMAVNAAGTGVEIRIPGFGGTGSTKLITVSSASGAPAELLTRLATHPEDFDIRSKGNTVIDWNDITFDALKLAGFAPAASVRVFSMVHTAINDTVQGILVVPGRRTYLASQGLSVTAAAAGANAELAAAVAARRVLVSIFSDPYTFTTNGGSVNPVFTPLDNQPSQNLTAYYTKVFDAAVESAKLESGASQASLDAAVAYGNAVADQLLALRSTDGFLRNVDGSQVKPADFNARFLDGIESAANFAGKDGSVSHLGDGTSLVGTGPQISAVTLGGVNLVFGVGKSSPGVWRRAEDTLNLGANGGYAGLASAEVASVNKTWVVPRTNFFSDLLNPPPALDSAEYTANVAEVKAEGSLLDLPMPAGTQVMVNNRTVTINGETRVISGLTALGVVVNDADPAETGYPAVTGQDAPSSIAGNTNGVDGIGTTSSERTVIAHVWANAEGGVGPNYAYQKVAQQLAINNRSSLADTALIFATLNQAFADGFENLWNEKWNVDYFWRPVSSVRNANQIAATSNLVDSAFTVRENTPQHPDFPSGTSVSAGLASTILRSFYGETQTFTVSADVNPASARLAIALAPVNGNVGDIPLEEVSRTYTSFAQVVNETRLSRIFAGAHFRFATEKGVQLGELVGKYYVDNNPMLVAGK